MKDYIQWFMKILLGDNYVDKETLNLWIIQRKNIKENEIKKIKVPHRHEEQMTIFDLVS